MMKLSKILDEVQRIYDEFGDVDGEMYDPVDMEMFQPVTHIQYDYDRERIQFLSDR
jgi:hypothetical protein